mmetsp:Transcript_28507/g.66816  ORF Transcript_28507/g.66816 Transcript_28507/m.66816 type:complete len:613 (+) Transcript_28507:67-1905(+)
MAAPVARDDEPPQPMRDALLSAIPRMLFLYAALTAYKGFASGNRAAARNTATTSVGTTLDGPVVNAFSDTPLELRVYLSDHEAFSAFDDPAALVWTQPLDLRHSTQSPALNHTPHASGALLRNESSAWAHIYLTRAGFSPDPRSERPASFGTAISVARHHRLVAYKRAGGRRKLRSLLGAEAGAAADPNADAAGESAEKEGLVPHWKPTLSIVVCSDTSVFPTRSSLPDALLAHLALAQLGASDAASALPAGIGGGAVVGRGPSTTAPSTVYMPRPFVNDVWIAERDLLPINSSTPLLSLRLELQVVSLLKLSLLSQLGRTLEEHASKQGDGDKGAASTEELRRMLTETNPYLLLVTFLVTVLHSLSSFLAFRNDIKFWKGTKSMHGLSTRSLLVGLVVHAITFLYLLDNDTSNMILVSNGIGLLIEAWKVQKICSISVCWEGTWPRVRINSRGDFAHSVTATYDQQATKYVAWVLLPLMAGTSLYTVVHSQHKSWYSWVLTSLVSAVYSFGFAQQAPQLFINYKLKSTAHMPWRTLCYKALNTFIDDLFAFIIKMPTMHRLSCLRDDVIFVIYIYQRYAYGVDSKRANEYGQCEEDGPLPEPARLLASSDS